MDNCSFVANVAFESLAAKEGSATFPGSGSGGALYASKQAGPRSLTGGGAVARAPPFLAGVCMC